MNRLCVRGSACAAWLVLLSGMLLTGRPAAAQDPTPNITGRVIVLGDIPVSDVEVRLEGTQRTVRTDQRGYFAFTGVGEGAQELSVRGIGYMPGRLAIRVPDRSLNVSITIVPSRAMLDTVQIRERINVLSGIVVDEENKPVAGATIQVITGEKRTVTSGEDGWFTLTSVREGVVVFQTRKEGYFATNTAVRMDEWRGVVVHMELLDPKYGATRAAEAAGTSNNALAALRDASMRMSTRGSRAVVVSAEELAPFADMSLGEAVRRTRPGASIAFELQSARGAFCVLLDGRRAVGSTTIDSWRATDVEMVELYPPGTESSGTVARYLRAAGCRTIAPSSGRTRGPFYAVLWMR